MEMMAMIALFISIAIMLSIGIVIIPQSQNCDLLPTTTPIQPPSLDFTYSKTLPAPGLESIPTSLNIAGDKMYISYYADNSFRTFTILADNTLVADTSVVLSEYVTAIALSGSYMLTIDDEVNTDIMYLYDFDGTTISNPTLLSYLIGTSVHGMVISNDKLFILYADNEIHSFDLNLSARTISSGVLLKTLPVGTWAGLTMISNNLYTNHNNPDYLSRIPYDASSNTLGDPITVESNVPTPLLYRLSNTDSAIFSINYEGIVDVFDRVGGAPIPGQTSTGQSWNGICLENEANARSSYSLLLIITIVIAAIAVLSIIRRLG